MAARLGDLVFLVANLWKETGVDNVICFSVPKEFAPPAAVTFTGIASQGGEATAQTLVLGEGGTIRNWSTGKPNKLLSLNLVWKIGA